MEIEQFTEDERVLKCLSKLKNHFEKEPMVVSDVLDPHGNQYVNLVQKGGGVLGVALVGYTFILEEMGIRFMRLAGTSAGAINTAMMTVIKEKKEAKSRDVLKLICDLNFFDLVDGHWFARFLIKNFITNKGFFERIKFWLISIFIALAALVFTDILLLIYIPEAPKSLIFTVITSLTIFLIILIFIGYFSVKYLLKRLKNAGFGINPGDFFYDWLKKNMHDCGVDTVADLIKKASEGVNGLKMRAPRNEDISDLKGDVTFITAELVTQNKIEFPLMWDLFRTEKNMDYKISPAGFVRASMSIPIFFESYYINEIPICDATVKEAWKNRFNVLTPPTTARFVDGGMLSNFPISIFYNPSVDVPRLPTFGIDLDDSDPENKLEDSTKWNLGGYLSNMFNTIRYYYDKDFVLKNKMFEKGIGKVKLPEFNWLNFFMKDKDKIEMFVKGAEAATEFLINFKWEEYMHDRELYQKDLNKKEKKLIQNNDRP
jgi:NTE family protein